MGSMKDLMIEQQLQKDEERLAEVLGISYDELMQLGHNINSEDSEEGVTYAYIVSFDDDAPKDVLAKVKGLSENNTVWLSPWDLDDYEDYYEEQYEAIISNKHYYESFKQEIASAEKLNNVEFEDKGLEGVLKRQIYSSIIGAVEAFLSETFINQTEENEEYFRNFIESFPDFKERKFEFSQIFTEHEKIKDTARKVILEIIYHNLAKVSRMYESTFKIEFPKIADLAKCVSIRHDLVHRNGKTKEGEVITIDKATVTDLVNKASSFVDEIAAKLNL